MGVTNHPPTPALRRAARALALTPALAVTVATGTAFAEAPDTWENTPSVSPLHALLIIAVIPIGLFVLITLLVYVPSMVRGERYQPGQAWRSEPEWFGGPRSGLDAVDEADRPAVGPGSSESTSGGTSGRW